MKKAQNNSRIEISDRRIPESSESIRPIPESLRKSRGKPSSSMSDCETQSSFSHKKPDEGRTS